VLFAWLITVALADTCGLWGSATPPVTVDEAPVDESSGVTASRTRAGVLFTHDDHGGDAALYAFDPSGAFLGTHPVSGATNEDWEDIAAAPCPVDGDCLYIGDIGDNDGSRRRVRVYIVPEPGDGEEAKVLLTLDARYPDTPQDAETLLVHPCSGVVYLVTKPAEGVSTVWRFPPESSQRTADLVQVASVNLDEGKISGGDYDPDGDRVVLRTRDTVWEWPVVPDTPELAWSAMPSAIATAPLLNSEAVSYTLDGTLVSTSEGAPLRVATTPCDDPVSIQSPCAFVSPYEAGCGCSHRGSSPWLLFTVLPLYLYRRHRV